MTVLDSLRVAVEEVRARRGCRRCSPGAGRSGGARGSGRRRCSTASRSVTSQSSYSPPISSASARRRSSRRASRTQCQPRRASRRAISAPMPDDAPVMTATRGTRARYDAAKRCAVLADGGGVTSCRPRARDVRTRCRPSPESSSRTTAPRACRRQRSARRRRHPGRLAATVSCCRALRALPARREQPVDGRPGDDMHRTLRERVFGMSFGPIVSMFFASWKSEAIMRVRAVPGASAGTVVGSGKTAIPVARSNVPAPTAHLVADRERVRVDAGLRVASRGRRASAVRSRHRVVRSLSDGGVTSFTHERST